MLLLMVGARNAVWMEFWCVSWTGPTQPRGGVGSFGSPILTAEKRYLLVALESREKNFESLHGTWLFLCLGDR